MINTNKLKYNNNMFYLLFFSFVKKVLDKFIRSYWVINYNNIYIEYFKSNRMFECLQENNEVSMNSLNI